MALPISSQVCSRLCAANLLAWQQLTKQIAPTSSLRRLSSAILSQHETRSRSRGGGNKIDDNKCTSTAAAGSVCRRVPLRERSIKNWPPFGFAHATDLFVALKTAAAATEGKSERVLQLGYIPAAIVFCLSPAPEARRKVQQSRRRQDYR